MVDRRYMPGWTRGPGCRANGVGGALHGACSSRRSFPPRRRPPRCWRTYRNGLRAQESLRQRPEAAARAAGAMLARSEPASAGRLCFRWRQQAARGTELPSLSKYRPQPSGPLTRGLERPCRRALAGAGGPSHRRALSQVAQPGRQEFRFALNGGDDVTRPHRPRMSPHSFATRISYLELQPMAAVAGHDALV